MPGARSGCQPLNPFGSSSASKEALAYAFGSLTEHDDVRQEQVDRFTGAVVREFQGLYGISSRQDLMPLAFQNTLDDVANTILVFN